MNYVINCYDTQTQQTTTKVVTQAELVSRPQAQSPTLKCIPTPEPESVSHKAWQVGIFLVGSVLIVVVLRKLCMKKIKEDRDLDAKLAQTAKHLANANEATLRPAGSAS